MKQAFFPGQRRKLVLADFYPKLNTEDEKRLCLCFSMSLSDQSLVGMPQGIGAAFEAVGKLDNGIPKCPFGEELEGITVELFPHDKAKRREQLLPAVTLRSFMVTRPDTENAKANEIELTFNTTVPGSRDLCTWAYENLGAVLYADFTQAQGSLELKTDETGEEDEETQRKNSLKPENDELFEGNRKAAKGKGVH
jgi:hypothetical protein